MRMTLGSPLIRCAFIAWTNDHPVAAESFVQMAASPELMALMAKRWPLTAANQRERDRLWGSMPLGWVTPGNPSMQKYSAYWGEKNDNVIIMVDGSTSLVYVCYYWNF